jgi:methylenetetrahydrofolate dehydrogenase (NADP+)/methenyltetrahydrofolate cyclohydrolase
MTSLISGQLLAERSISEIAETIARLKHKPGLTMIIVGNNSASLVYVSNKQKLCARVGIISNMIHLPENASANELRQVIEGLNAAQNVHGILLQLPLPKHLNASDFLCLIDPKKDVDGLHPHNLGLLMSGQPGLVPCTPQGCLQMIQSVMPDISGANAVVLGRSVLVGKPMALLLCQHDATVTLVHSKSRDIKKICQSADIVVSAMGAPGLLDPTYFNSEAIVIDVGITSVEGTIKGDVNYDDVFGYVRALSPVPGGVGPMTVMNLMLNTLKAFQNFT